MISQLSMWHHTLSSGHSDFKTEISQCLLDPWLSLDQGHWQSYYRNTLSFKMMFLRLEKWFQASCVVIEWQSVVTCIWLYFKPSSGVKHEYVDDVFVLLQINSCDCLQSHLVALQNYPPWHLIVLIMIT